jgi:nicotinamide mononucleotide adenylyltransferase
LGKQDHGNQLLKYYCSKCDTLLKETNIDIGLSNSKEECPHCGSSLVSETLKKENEHKTSSIIMFTQQRFSTSDDKNNIAKVEVRYEYPPNDKINSESQQIQKNHIKNIENQHDISNELFGQTETNNFVILEEQRGLSLYN